MKFAAVGDILVQRRIPEDYEGFEEIKNWLCGADVRYFNLETTLHNEGECFGFQDCGGSYLRADPAVLEDCKRYGFNMISFCNNHTFDYGYEGMYKTLEYVQKSGLVHAGVGMNLDQAAAPGYLDTKEGRTALISITASCNDICMAGKQSRRVKGRPGVNQLRVQETLMVTPEQLKVLKDVADQTEVNAGINISIREGYRPAPPADTLAMGNLRFRAGEKAGKIAKCNPKDLERVAKAISEAQYVSDFILVAFHAHQVGGVSKEVPGQFLEEFSRFCIDHGADAVIGSGPHLLRPLEIYKGKPIFYSLGDFVMMNECIPYSPEDFFEKYGLDSDQTMREALRVRSADHTRGLATQRVMFETVIPRWEIKDGKMTKLELLPVECGFGLPMSRVGLPKRAPDDSILRRLAKMSEAYGTRMEIKDGIANVLLD